MLKLVALLLSAVAVPVFAGEATYPWLLEPPGDRLGQRITVPEGYQRIAVAPGSFGAWLRGLPLLPGRPPVSLYNGSLKWNQNAHFAVIDIDVGKKDLQQCADAVMRLRAEYLFAQEKHDQISFNFTNGEPARWTQWAAGYRPKIQGREVLWNKHRPPATGYPAFRGYLETVFTYAGTASLSNELQVVHQPLNVAPGDVFIQGGFPGHAVLVVDVAVNQLGHHLFLLAQSYMPAQQMHILINPNSERGPWYPARASGDLITPEWVFKYTDLKRFVDADPAKTVAAPH